MTIYLIGIALALILAPFAYRCGSKGRIIYLVITLGYLALVSGFRGLGIGSDTLGYFNVFERAKAFSSLFDAIGYSEITAPVYIWENWTIAKIGGDYRGVLLVNSFLISFLVGRFAYKTTDNVVLAVLCYVGLASFFQSMNGMRQYMAVCLMANAYLCLIDSDFKSKGGWLLLLAAIGVHNTAFIIVLSLALALYCRRASSYKRSLKMIIIVGAAAAILFQPLLRLFISIFPYYDLYAGGESTYSIYESNAGGRIVLLYFALGVVTAFGYLKLDAAAYWDDLEIGAKLFPLAILTAVFGVAFSGSFLFNRLIWFFSVGFIGFIPYCVNKAEGGEKVLLLMFVIAFLGIWCALQLIENKSGVVPYVLGVGDFMQGGVR